MTRNQQIAETILSQLGGGRFRMMTGAKEFIAVENGLQMRLPSNMTKGRTTHLTITLTPEDLYDLKAVRIIGMKAPVTVAEEKGFYVDSLRSTFERVTGLAVSL